MNNVFYSARVRIASVFPLLSMLALPACSDTQPGSSDSGNASGGLSNGGSSSAYEATTGGKSTASKAATGGKSATSKAATGGKSATSSAASGGKSATSSAATGGKSATSSAATGGKSATSSAATGGKSATSSAATGGKSSTSSAATGGVATGGSGSGSDPVLHIFMLMGQSNMAGVAKFDAGDKNTDERLKVWGGCNQPAGKWNIANPPLNDCPGEKGWNPSDSVDPGIWFGKTLLTKLPAGHTIGLVGTAESGESINTFISGGTHHQMILNKIAAVKTTPNSRFAGVIFHQGESDSGQETWPDKVVQLYKEVKAAFGVSYDVPFILGELPQGGCCGGHNTRVHEAAEKLPMGSWVSQEGTAVLDQYHFDHASVILMGKRYGEKMISELGW